jgi:hypothetical protein
MTEVIGKFCREVLIHRDLGCSGKGRPTCKMVECMYGAEPCEEGAKVGLYHFKGEGLKCNFCIEVGQVEK